MAVAVCHYIQERFLSQRGIDPGILEAINSLPEDNTIHVSTVETI